LSSSPHLHLEAVSASVFSFDELAEIYNQTRVDYIVPMPMNAKRLAEYVGAYDVDLKASLVVKAKDKKDQILAVSMLGLRGDRAWITRLGVLPVRRRMGTGQFIMDHHLATTYQHNARLIQLEVIKDNVPAHQLFLKNGFYETRELLVIRRPPAPPPAVEAVPCESVEELSQYDIETVLGERDEGAAWTEESMSLINAGHLKGIQVVLPSGLRGQLVYQSSPFQLTHLVFSRNVHHHPDLALALLHQLHHKHPSQDTKVENLPVDDPLWDAYQDLGYFEVFRRIEMFLNL
jgi:ribosomal protein S18 acetylase RimI-like enzyme